MTTILPQEDNPALRSISREIPQGEIQSPRIRKLIRGMEQLLSTEEYGVALAAVQVGAPVRLFIVSGKALTRGARNAPDEENKKKREDPPAGSAAIPNQIYINPVLLKRSRGKINKHEGCLSIRGTWGIVPRAEKATIRAFDGKGKEFTRGATGFLAHIFQHEMDHLEGILYTDKAIEMYDEEAK